jgi:formylmethanofuran dehydrogenase subunit E
MKKQEAPITPNLSSAMKSSQKVTICSHEYDEYINIVKSFHGHIAPGVAIGGFMVDLAVRHLPDGEFFDAFCETRVCLPDAIQLLTPCTIGNGWLRIIDFGRYALTLYEKFGGEGVRVFIDPHKLEKWSEVNAWFFKLKKKKDQDFELLMREIKQAGSDYCGLQRVRLKPEYRAQNKRKGFAICPVCNESHPVDDGNVCRACQGETVVETLD